MKITSVNNELIKETAKLLQRKYRDEKGLFLLEGEKCIQEALASGLEIVHIFEIEGCKSFSNSIDVTEPVMSKISSTVTPPKAVAIAKSLRLNGMMIINMLCFWKILKMPVIWVRY